MLVPWPSPRRTYWKIRISEQTKSGKKEANQKGEMEKEFLWASELRWLSLGFDWVGLGRHCPGLVCALVCPLVYPPDGPVLALVLSAAPSWLCRLCLCKKFVYCLLSRALPGRERERGGKEEGEEISRPRWRYFFCYFLSLSSFYCFSYF